MENFKTQEKDFNYSENTDYWLVMTNEGKVYRLFKDLDNDYNGDVEFSILEDMAKVKDVLSLWDSNAVQVVDTETDSWWNEWGM